MTAPIQEQLSAFCDGELSAAEAELLLKRLQRDPQLRATAGRYGLIGEALRSTQAGGPSREFAAQISKAIEREALPHRAWRPVVGWLKPVAGGAIAAGVAAVALVSLRITPLSNTTVVAAVDAGTGSSSSQPVEVRTVPAAANADAAPRYTVPTNNSNRTAPPILMMNGGRLASFVIAHSEYSSPLGQRNVLTGLLVEDPTAEQGDVLPANAEPAAR